MTVRIYGIKNCDTMKKAFQWLEEHSIEYDFIDYKKQGADKSVLTKFIKTHGWENVINRRGTTWRQLDDTTKQSMNDQLAISVALDNPSIIKRPLLINGDDIALGFSADQYEGLLK